LLNTIAAIAAKGAAFRSLGDAWADTTTAHGRLMLTVLGGLAEFERELIRARTSEGRKRAIDAGVKMGRPPKLDAFQKREALKRLKAGESPASLAAATRCIARQSRGWRRERRTHDDLFIDKYAKSGALMMGQWLGKYAGTSVGTLVVDLDDMGTHYEGRAYIYDDNPGLPSAFANVKTENKEPEVQLRLQLLPIDPRSGDATTWNQLASSFPNIVFPTFADVTVALQGDTLSVDWRTNIETTGSAQLPRTRSDAPTDYVPLPNVSNWAEFKSFVNALDHRRYIFRGQKERKRLRTSFHRTRRADLINFLTNDLQTLHRHLSLRTSHVFNLAIPDQNGAFLNLAQHHGYPTPLLDWTFSPFVGAFFAYRRFKNSEASSASDDEKVRIFVFDQKRWRARYPQFSKLTQARPHFSILEFIAIDNERMIPQQSISSVTNLDDIETYIRSLETPDNQYLQIIDLPVKERPLVMQELSVMGITAGSLFPGLDGACEELRERFFQL
jgi:hypothetical protein